MRLVDPDTIINWYKVDEPGEDPKWESLCGVVVQTKSGTTPEYVGFVEDKPLEARSTLPSAKRIVEARYFQLHPEKRDDIGVYSVLG